VLPVKVIIVFYVNTGVRCAALNNVYVHQNCLILHFLNCSSCQQPPGSVKG